MALRVTAGSDAGTIAGRGPSAPSRLPARSLPAEGSPHASTVASGGQYAWTPPSALRNHSRRPGV